MDLEKEYQEALEFVATIDFTKSDEAAKGFETNIRYLGGLLSAYDLRGDKILVEKAVELADKVLMPLFESPSKAPYTYFDFKRYAHFLMITLFIITAYIVNFQNRPIVFY